MRPLRILTAAFFAATLVACGLPPVPTPPDGSDPTDGGEAPDQIRVGSWNVHLFFDTVCESDACGGDAFEQVPSAARFGARADEIAGGVRALGADIVLLQEIESEAALEALTFRLPDYPDAVLGETGWPGSVDVGVLSRWPIQGVKRHRSRTLVRPDGTTTTFTREFLEVHVQVGATRVIAFTAHFRSKNGDDPGRRLAEAEAAAAIIAETAAAHPDAVLVFGGDLNDVPGSDTLQALEAGGDLLRVASELGSGAATYRFDGTDFALDHLYHELEAAGAYVPGSAEVVKDRTWGLGGSDHSGLRASFRLR